MPAHEQQRRRIVDVGEQRRIAGFAPKYGADIERHKRGQFIFGRRRRADF